MNESRHNKHTAKRQPWQSNYIAKARLRELELVLAWFWNDCVLPSDDAGEDDLDFVFAHCKAVGLDWDRASLHSDRLAPWMPTEDAKCIFAAAEAEPVRYLTADQMAERYDVTYEVRQNLGLRTIGAIDIDKAGRDKLTRKRYNAQRKAKRREKARAKTARKRAALKPRQKAVLAMVGRTSGGMCTAGYLYLKAKRHREFRDLDPDSVPRTVLRIIRELMEAGHLGGRYEDRPIGGNEWFIWRENPKQEKPLQQATISNLSGAKPLISKAQTTGQKSGVDHLRHTPKKDEVGDEKGIYDKPTIERAGRLGAAVAFVKPPPGRTAIAPPSDKFPDVGHLV